MFQQANNFNLSVDKLAQKIQEDVARRHRLSSTKAVGIISNFTPISSSLVNYIKTLLDDAEFQSQVPSSLPDKLDRFPFNLKIIQNFLLNLYNFLFKKQRVVNHDLIQAQRESLSANQQLYKQTTAFQSSLNKLDELQAKVDERLSAIEDSLASVEKRLAVNNIRLNSVEKHFTSVEEAMNGQRMRLFSTEERFESIEQRLATINEQNSKDDAYLKNEIAQQKRLIALFLEEATQPPKQFSQKKLQILDEGIHSLDAFYVALEDEFRGSPQDIRNRLEIYLPLVEEAVGQFSILDLGCGRGEWLELLHESGYVSRGVDINKVMVEQCQAKGIEVVESDLIAYLQSLPDDSVGAVTGFHVIEHLPFKVLIQLFDETVRVLKSGGVAIFETPNPENMLVGCCNFYLDPTHRHPLPSQLSQFIARSRGLSEVEIRYLHPSTALEVTEDAIAQRFNQYFYGAQDYSVIGYKR